MLLCVRSSVIILFNDSFWLIEMIILINLILPNFKLSVFKKQKLHVFTFGSKTMLITLEKFSPSTLYYRYFHTFKKFLIFQNWKFTESTKIKNYFPLFKKNKTGKREVRSFLMRGVTDAEGNKSTMRCVLNFSI